MAGWQEVGGGIKDASRRRCRSPSALLDPAAAILLGGLAVGTKERRCSRTKERSSSGGQAALAGEQRCRAGS